MCIYIVVSLSTDEHRSVNRDLHQNKKSYMCPLLRPESAVWPVLLCGGHDGQRPPVLGAAVQAASTAQVGRVAQLQPECTELRQRLQHEGGRSTGRGH